MKTWTLQARLTAIVAAILLSACLLLTTNSLFAARAYYGDYAALLESGLVEVDPAWEEGAGPDDALASPIEFYREASQKFSAQSLLAMALIALLAVGSTYLATGQVLRPLKNLTASAGVIDGRHLDRRVPEAGAQGEVLALTRSFNGMLGRLEESFLIQKRFAASAAHELKTPLAVIKSALQVLEMAPHPSEADYREFMADTGESLERIIKTVDGLLSLANPKEVPMDETVELRPVLDLAVREDSENPVYYVQYAHARICSLLSRLGEEGEKVPAAQDVDASLMTTPEELALMKALAQFPEEIHLAARDYDPSRINRYLVSLAGDFHRFYNACRIKGEADAVLNARLLLADCVRSALATCLNILGVSAPERM